MVAWRVAHSQKRTLSNWIKGRRARSSVAERSERRRDYATLQPLRFLIRARAEHVPTRLTAETLCAFAQADCMERNGFRLPTLRAGRERTCNVLG